MGDARALVGSQVRHYRVLRLIGAGGMGAVYLARDVRLGRLVALKLVSEELAGKAEVRAQLQPGEPLSHRISFLQTWQTLEPLWLILLVCADIITPQQQQAIRQRLYDLAAQRVMAPKRSRSCFRGMRQPQQPWPRKRNQPSVEGPVKFNIVRT